MVNTSGSRASELSYDAVQQTHMDFLLQINGAPINIDNDNVQYKALEAH